MAEVNGNYKNGYTSSVTEDVAMGNAGQGIVATMVLQIIANASWDGSVLIKGRLTGSTNALATLAYVDRTSATNAVQASALSGTTANKIVEVDAAGLDIFVSHTQGAGPTGSVTIRAVRMNG